MPNTKTIRSTPETTLWAELASTRMNEQPIGSALAWATVTAARITRLATSAGNRCNRETVRLGNDRV